MLLKCKIVIVNYIKALFRTNDLYYCPNCWFYYPNEFADDEAAEY